MKLCSTKIQAIIEKNIISCDVIFYFDSFFFNYKVCKGFLSVLNIPQKKVKIANLMTDNFNSSTITVNTCLIECVLEIKHYNFHINQNLVFNAFILILLMYNFSLYY